MLEDWQKQRQKYFFSKPCLSCLKTKCRPIWSPFLDQGPKGKDVKIRKLIEDKIRRKKLKNHVFFLHSYPGFSFLLYAMSCLVSMFLLLDWRAANHVFIAPFKGNSWCLMVPAMEGKKGVVSPFDQWKLSAGNQNMNQNISVSFFAFFYCKSAGICILELMHWIFPK